MAVQPTPNTSGSGSSSGAIAQLAALQKKMIKEMTALQGLEVQFQGTMAPLTTGKSDARNLNNG
jgi:hypothetical protein